MFSASYIVFDYADLTDLPETESANVLVEIDMMPWVDNEIYWNN